MFDFQDYRKYIDRKIADFPRKGHGIRTKIAVAMGCKPAYLTNVLSGKAHLSLEQAHRLNRFFTHQDEESDFFMLLVESARAGTEELRQYFQKKIDRIKKKRQLLHQRIRESASALEPKHRSTYYSQWYYAAIHMAVMLQELRTREMLSQALAIPPSTITRAVRELIGMGLLTEKNGKLETTEKQMHLPANTPEVQQHHRNWRLYAAARPEHDPEKDLHYTGISALSEADFQKIRERLMSEISSIRRVVEKSPEQRVVCLNLDWFEVGSGSRT